MYLYSMQNEWPHKHWPSWLCQPRRPQSPWQSGGSSCRRRSSGKQRWCFIYLLFCSPPSKKSAWWRWVQVNWSSYCECERHGTETHTCPLHDLNNKQGQRLSGTAGDTRWNRVQSGLKPRKNARSVKGAETFQTSRPVFRVLTAGPKPRSKDYQCCQIGIIYSNFGNFGIISTCWNNEIILE